VVQTLPHTFVEEVTIFSGSPGLVVSSFKTYYFPNAEAFLDDAIGLSMYY
jgi:hypothetical protein